MNQKPSRSGAVVNGIEWGRWSVILFKPDAVERGLVDEILDRLSDTDVFVGRQDVIVAPWQIHVHYWDMLVDRDWFSGRDMPACLDELYVGRTVTTVLAYGPPGIHAAFRDRLGHFDPTQAAAGTIRGDFGDDSLDRALAEKRLINNLVHASDDPEAARRDFGTWYGSNRRGLLHPVPAPRPRARTQS
ncbi:Nucleoside diphosphate kinase (plasmid) [Streptomyces sp. ADI95-16]|uniref:nucleoside-diphosphate kinase n=1 Tax=Streptomyces sp. ADI95-16 TaxID=1522758 RepID=UPI000F3A913E|nr:nucleoside-diphosphate kinase [Streptomyces sp. ADI95-16]AYV32892.1 Nucleoside diphosphate kinase [Streptomyces sp. ADI95-16]